MVALFSGRTICRSDQSDLIAVEEHTQVWYKLECYLVVKQKGRDHCFY